MTEADVVALFRRLSPPMPAGIGDDCAVLPDGSVVTTDAMVEGVHWDGRCSAEDVGWKLAMVNASDINAMGEIGRAHV